MFNKIITFLRPTSAIETLYQEQTPDSLIEVKQASGRRWLSFGGNVYQSVALHGQALPHMVWSYFLLLPYFLSGDSKNLSVCILGLGGGIAANSYHHFFEPQRIVGVEISSSVIRVAKKYFDLEPTTETVADDAKNYVQQSTDRFHCIVVDLFDKDKTIPLVAEHAFLDQVIDHLDSSGAIAINCSGNAVDTNKIVDYLKTRQLAVFALPLSVKGINNTVIYATNQKQSLSDIKHSLQNEKRPEFATIIDYASQHLIEH